MPGCQPAGLKHFRTNNAVAQSDKTRCQWPFISPTPRTTTDCLAPRPINAATSTPVLWQKLEIVAGIQILLENRLSGKPKQ